MPGTPGKDKPKSKFRDTKSGSVGIESSKDTLPSNINKDDKGSPHSKNNKPTE